VEKHGIAGEATDGNIMRRMRSTCRIIKAAEPHPEYVTLLASPRQEWLRERATVTRSSPS
jgi:hypothetical protein